MITKGEITRLVPSHSKLGFYLFDTESNEHIAIQEQDWFPLASVSKLITAIVVLSKHPDIGQEEIVDSISKHCRLSYEKIMEQVPDEVINQQLRELNIDLKVNANNQDKVKNSGTAKGVFEVLYRLLKGGILDDCPKQWVMEGLRLQNDMDGLFRKDNIWNHMTGGFDGVCNDVGYVEIGSRKIIVIGLLETKDSNIEWHQLEAIMQKIGEHIMFAFEGVFK